MSVTPQITDSAAALAFFTCIERGFLEEQSLLLYQSIRRFGGRYRNAPIYACCPRANRGIAPQTRSALEMLGVTYLETTLNRELDYFGYANKNFAAAYLERATRHDILVFLDSDTLLLHEPELIELPEEVDVRVRPVDLKGICSGGPGDPFDDYWRELSKLCGVDLEALPFINATVDRARIRANYNGGFVAARTGLGIFERWEENVLAAHRAKLWPRPDSFWGTGQSTLAVAIHATTSRVELLPDAYNYPLHLHDQVDPARRIRGSRDVTHLHYHWMLEQGTWPSCALAQPDFIWETDAREWLLARVPLAHERDPTDHGIRRH